MPKGAPDTADARLAALHRTPPREFVARRDALARELAAAGDPRSAEVRALARPTLPVWAINLAARDDPEALHALLASAEAVVREHRLVLGGASGEALLAANRALGAALERAVASAARAARQAGTPLSRAMMLRARTTLRSMALGDGRARGALRAGRVLAESADAGLEALEGLSPMRPRPVAREAPRREDAGRQRAELAAARRSARGAAQDLRRAEAQAARARADLEDAQRRGAEAQRRLGQAEARAAQARRRSEEAGRTLERLERG